MNKTHIIIPIKDIEDKIKTLTKFLEVAQTKLDQGKRQMLYELLDTSKQISLSEEDIEEKANKYGWKKISTFSTKVKANEAVEYASSSYKQALKDLLK